MDPSSASVVRAIIEQSDDEHGDIPRDLPNIFYPPFVGEPLAITGRVCIFFYWNPEHQCSLLADQSLNHARRMQPFRLLPRFLIGPHPTEAADVRAVPPVFYCGWRPDFKKMLEVAKARKLVVVLPPMDDEEYNYPTQATEDPAASFITFRLVVQSLMDELERKGVLGRWCRRIEGRTTLRYDDGHNFVISVLTNYDLTRSEVELPTPDEMKRLSKELQASLGITDAPPRWYIDDNRYEWHDPELNNAIDLPGSAKWHVDYDAYGQTVTEYYDQY